MDISHKYYFDEITKISFNNKYQKWYRNICVKATLRGSNRKIIKGLVGYVEAHHVLPKSFLLGGEKDRNNLVYLTAKEHFVCHRLLTKMFPKDSGFGIKMQYALWLMATAENSDQNRYRISSRIYAFIKSEFAKMQGPVMAQRVSGEGNPMFGKTGNLNPTYGKRCPPEIIEMLKNREVSPETRKKISQANSGRKRSDAVKLEMSRARRGRALSDVHRESLSRVKSGANNPMFGRRGELNPNYGKPLSEKTKAKLKAAMVGRIRGPMSEEHKNKIRESNLGQVRSEETRNKMRGPRPSLAGTNNPNYGKPRPQSVKDRVSEANSGTIWINNGVYAKKVKLERLPNFEAEGWKRGRKFQAVVVAI